MTHPLAYVVPGIVVWACTLESGVHATIAGVVLGLLTPNQEFRGRPVIDRLEHLLHPSTSFVVIPVFALANAGVDLGGGALGDAATSSITVGIILGLVVGKTVGITTAVMSVTRFRLGRLPEGVGVRHVVGAAALAGIGFTVSLFIADLSFAGASDLEEAKIGILVGSLVSGLLGAAVLFRRAREPTHA